MKKIIIAILLLGLVMSCSKEETKPTVVEPPIKFTVDATPNNYEYVNRVSQNTINASFKTLPRIEKGSEAYLVEASITSDFSAVKTSNLGYSSSITDTEHIVNLSLLVRKDQFPFQGIIYFRVKRVKDVSVSETRSIKVNWN